VKETDMAITARAQTAIPPTKGTPMSPTRKTALVAGVFYLITFISIPTLALYGPVKNHRDWILSSGSHTGLLVGGLLEVIMALASIGTAVTLYPVVKRQNESVALGFVAARVLEAVMLSLVSLRQDLGTGVGAAGANAASLVTIAASHVAVYNWTFLLSQTLMPGINALLLGSLLYRSRLVPRAIPLLGLIGGPLLIIAVFATLLGQHSSLTGLATLPVIPVAAWELSLGLWLVVKGFRPAPITAELTAASTPLAYQDVAV
jgi:NADH:ubiquinone oxidoreductase subunit K